MKPSCDWCGEAEYHIGILTKENKEELICKTCFKKFIEKNQSAGSVKNTEIPSVPGESQ